jgi:Holliday junction resolvase RusA-like endonuclease
VTISFVIEGEPPTATHQSKRLFVVCGHARIADTPELNKAKRWYAAKLAPHVPPAPLSGPLSLTLRFVWPFRKSESRRSIAYGDLRKDTHPDCSNLAKTIEDQMAKLGFMANDSIVAELHVSKWWGARPGVEVTLCELREGAKSRDQLALTEAW